MIQEMNRTPITMKKKKRTKDKFERLSKLKNEAIKSEQERQSQIRDHLKNKSRSSAESKADRAYYNALMNKEKRTPAVSKYITGLAPSSSNESLFRN